MLKRMLIVAGEVSGDMHGAALVREIHALAPDVQFAGLGGAKMREAGVAILHDLTRHAVVGLAGIAENLAGFIRAYRIITHRLSADPPDAIVLVDFPDFNLMVAEHAARVGVPVIYYVSPQLWAWRTGRVEKIARCVRKMLVFFDFEREFYERHGVDAAFVGHPLLDSMADKLDVTDDAGVRRALGLAETGLLVGLLPGSRRKEIKYILPVLLGAAELVRRERPDVRFVLPRAPGITQEQIDRVARKFDVPFTTVDGRAHDVMIASDLLLICSGTATLEAGLLATPMVATYTGDWLSYTLIGPLIKTRTYALANIAAGEKIVPEYYCIDAKPRLIADSALALLNGGLAQMRRRLGVIRQKLGQPGASRRAAEEILKLF